MGILEVLTIITLILFPLGELWRISAGDNITLHPIDISVFLLAISWIILQKINKKNILKITFIKPILIFSIICVFSLLVNLYWLRLNEVAISALYLLRWLSYAGIYFATKDLSNSFKSKILIPFLVIDGLLILVLGYIQLFFYPSLIGLQIYGWDKHIYRMFSVFLDPNYAGAFFSLYFLFISGLFFQSFKKKKYKWAATYAVIAALTLISVYLTYSRSALLMCLTGSFVFLALINKKKLILFMLILTLFFILLSSPNFYIENVNLFRVNSSKERIESANIALQIIQKNPLLGVGFNAYRYAQIKYNFRSSYTKYPSHADAGTDNSFLFVAVTTGLTGLIAYLYIWFNFLKKAYLKSKDNNPYAIIILSSVIGLSISAQFINSLFFGALMLWIWIGFSLIDLK